MANDNEKSTNTNASIVKEGFGSTELQVQHETAGSAVAARARAEIEARYVMALRNPRSWDQVRTNLLHECKRPGFARAARYRKPVGAGIEGPSIRFAEAALRHMRNVSPRTMVTYDDPTKLILCVSVTDVEANVTFDQDVVVQKTVERRKLGKGQRPLATRTNSFGDAVYIVEATDDEILNKVNALVSKALRTLALRLLPGDILEECMATCIRVAETEDAKDPDAARKALVDAFFGVGVQAQQLVAYLGHDLSAMTPAELTTLRALYAAIRDEETTWAEVLDAQSDPGEGEQTSAAKAKVDALVEQHKSAKKKPQQQTQQTQQPAPADVDAALNRSKAPSPEEDGR